MSIKSLIRNKLLIPFFSIVPSIFQVVRISQQFSINKRTYKLNASSILRNRYTFKEQLDISLQMLRFRRSKLLCCLFSYFHLKLEYRKKCTYSVKTSFLDMSHRYNMYYTRQIMFKKYNQVKIKTFLQKQNKVLHNL